MSLSDPVVLAYDGGNLNFARINQDNYGAEYYVVSGTKRLTLSIKHTKPAAGEPGESHLIRLDVEHYDANGLLLRKASAWTVIRTDLGIQDQESSEDVTEALVALLTAGNITKFVGRES